MLTESEKYTKPLLIIVEGCQGSGKTTLTNFLRENIPYSQLFRLSGNRLSGNKEDVPRGELKSFLNHMAISEMLTKISYSGNNAILDRSYLSEMVYSKLYRNSSFDIYADECLKAYTSLKLHYNVVLVFLVVRPTTFEKRLSRDKAVFGVHEFNKEKSILQQKAYNDVIKNHADGFRRIILQDVDIEEENFLQSFLEAVDERY